MAPLPLVGMRTSVCLDVTATRVVAAASTANHLVELLLAQFVSVGNGRCRIGIAHDLTVRPPSLNVTDCGQ